MIIDYEKRIEFLLKFESDKEVEISLNTIDNTNRIVVVTCGNLVGLIIIPEECDNVNDIHYYGIDRGKTLRALTEGFSEEEVFKKIENFLPIEDEQNFVNFLVGKKFLKLNEKCIKLIQELDLPLKQGKL